MQTYNGVLFCHESSDAVCFKLVCIHICHTQGHSAN